MSKVRVTLVRPPHSIVYGVYKAIRQKDNSVGIPKEREIKPPLGLLCLAGALESIGVDVSIIDAEPLVLMPEAITERVLATEPDFVGVTSSTPEFHIAAEVVKLVKQQNPRIITMAGGAHVTVLPEQTLREHPYIDYVCVGEGEESIKKIVRDRPQERIIRSEAVQDLDSLAPPARHLINYDDYAGSEPEIGMVRVDAIETSRGCPFRCAFCYHMHGNRVRFRDVQNVVDEIEKSHYETGANLFHFFDDTFTLKKDRAIAICNEILKRKLKLNFYCFTRADTISKDLLEKMKETGFIRITMGIESGNQEMLNRYNKGTKLEDYERAYRWMVELGIETRGSFIVGGPHETRESIKDSIRFARKLPLYRVGVNILTPYPGTPFYDTAINGDDGLRLLCTDWKEYRRWGTSVVETDALSAPDLEYYQKKFLREFYGSAKVVFYHLKLFLKGNHSYYYFRPVIFAVMERFTSGIKEIFKPHKFTPPSHKNSVQPAKSMAAPSGSKTG